MKVVYLGVYPKSTTVEWNNQSGREEVQINGMLRSRLPLNPIGTYQGDDRSWMFIGIYRIHQIL
jgi:hypothetical protein